MYVSLGSSSQYRGWMCASLPMPTRWGMHINWSGKTKTMSPQCFVYCIIFVIPYWSQIKILFILTFFTLTGSTWIESNKMSLYFDLVIHQNKYCNEYLSNFCYIKFQLDTQCKLNVIITSPLWVIYFQTIYTFFLLFTLSKV